MPTRGQTRYLFIMVAVDLVKDFLVNSSLDYSHGSISSAIIKFADAGLLTEMGESGRPAH